ncbi:cyclic-di-AMP receptor [Symbiobacterium terraclitae]|nr:cyclic-di-AMP receptor [Symbiobacterium terraclitae]
MIVAVVRDEYAAAVTDALTRKGFGATKLASTGGFMKRGNTTFLVGVGSAQLDDALATIRGACPAVQPAQGEAKAPRAAEEHGATVFVLDVERMLKA